MLTLVELFLDALSIGQDLRRDREDRRDRRANRGKALTIAMWAIAFVIVLVMIKLI